MTPNLMQVRDMLKKHLTIHVEAGTKAFIGHQITVQLRLGDEVISESIADVPSDWLRSDGEYY